MTERVYLLVDPRVTDPVLRVRYVGWTRKSLAQRLERHMSSAAHSKSRTHRLQWIRGLAAMGFVPGIELYAEVPAGRGQAAEIAAIRLMRLLGADLTNRTDGGDGVSGYVPTEEQRRRLGDYWRGKKQPAEMVEARRAGLRRAWAEGRRSAKTPAWLWNPEVREKIGAAQRGRSLSAERRQAISTFLTGKRHSAETRAKMSASARRWRGARRSQQELF